MKSKRKLTRDEAGVGGDAFKGDPRLPRVYSKPELTSYGNLVELTRTVGGGAPDGFIGTIGT